MSTKQSAIDAVAEAIYNRNPASVSEGLITWTEAVEDWPEHVREARANARAAILAYLSALARDEASVEAVARAMCKAGGDDPDGTTCWMGPPTGKENWRLFHAEARAVIATLLERAKEQQG
jgi:hypothetical protein